MTELCGEISVGILEGSGGARRGYSLDLAAGGSNTKCFTEYCKGGVHYSKLDKSMIVILRSICGKVRSELLL